MAHQCEICQFVDRVAKPDMDSEQNDCFVKRNAPYSYRPFKGAETTIPLSCQNFSHIRTGRFTLRQGGTKVTIHATPEEPNPVKALERRLYNRNAEQQAELERLDAWNKAASGE